MHLTKSDVLGISLFLILGSCINHAKADFEINAGVSKYGLVGSGIWWDENYPHSLDLTNHAFSIGFTGNISPKFDWRAGYLDLGKLTTDSVGLSDDTRPERKHCLSRFQTESHVTGLYGSVLTNGDLYIEVGLFAFNPDFKVTMIDMPAGYYDNGDRFGRDDIMGVKNSTLSVKPFIGVGYRYKQFNISAHHYSLDNQETDQYSTVYKNATTVMVGYVF